MALIIRDKSATPTPDPTPAAPDPAVIRKRYLNDEASIQGVGSLYLLGAVILVPLAIAGLLGFPPFAQTKLLCVFWIIVGSFQGWTGWQLRKLDPRSKVGATLISCLGLLAFPFGTMISGYILYLIHSAKGKYIFSPEYRAVIEATPQIRYKMSVIVWILIWLLVAILLLLVIGTLFAKH